MFHVLGRVFLAFVIFMYLDTHLYKSMVVFVILSHILVNAYLAQMAWSIDYT